MNDKTVSKGMVKYASNITRESIVDVEGEIQVPKAPIEGCSQSQVSASPCYTFRVVYVWEAWLAFSAC